MEQRVEERVIPGRAPEAPLPFGQRLLKPAHWLSLVLCLSAIAAWGRSRSVADSWNWGRPGDSHNMLYSVAGRLGFVRKAITARRPSGAPLTRDDYTFYHVFDPQPFHWPYYSQDSQLFLRIHRREKSVLGFGHARRVATTLDGDTTVEVSYEVPYWLPLTAFAILSATAFAALRARARRRMRRRRGLCLGCGYDLRASPDRCPECGIVVKAAPPV